MNSNLTLLLTAVFLLATQIVCQTSTCLCSGAILDCSTPGDYNFTTTQNQTVYIATKFQQNCQSGISFTPTSAFTSLECQCAANLRNTKCSDFSTLGNYIYYPMIQNTVNGNAPNGYYCFFGDYATCQILQIQGVFSKSSQHCFTSTVYQPVYLDSKQMENGLYTQQTQCQQADLPLGYLLLSQNTTSQLIYDYTPTGINSNGLWFIPESSPQYIQTEQVMQAYNSGNSVLMPNWMYQVFNQETSIANQQCNTKQTLPIKSVKPSVVNQCTVQTQFKSGSTSSCFQISNCSSQAGFQGTYQFSDSYFQINQTQSACNLNGQICQGITVYSQNQTNIYFSVQQGSCQYAFQQSSLTSDKMQQKCYFDPTAGQIANVTDGKKPSQFQGLPQLPNIFGSISVLIIIIVCSLVMLVMCSMKQEETSLEEHEHHEETKNIKHVSGKYILYLSSLSGAVLLLFCQVVREYFFDTLWIAIFYLCLFSALLLNLHHGNNQNRTHTMSTIQSAGLSISSLSVMFSVSWTAWISFLILLFSFHQIYQKKARVSSVFCNVVFTNAVLSAEFYTVSVNKNCDVVFQDISLWLWFAILILIAVVTAEKGQPETILSAISIGLYAVQLEYSDKKQICPQKHSREWILTFMYVTSLLTASAAIYIFSLKKSDTHTESLLIM